MINSKASSDDDEFQDQEHITLGLLNAVDENSKVTQRSLANELGVALGLTNSYIKRCAKKGFIKVREAPANRFAYYLTPRGLAEKSRLSADYLKQSFKFFRVARTQAETLFNECYERGWVRIGLVGKSDLTEITILSAADINIELAGIIDDVEADQNSAFMNIPIVNKLSDLGTLHALVITEMEGPQKIYDELINYFPKERVLALPLLKLKYERPGKKGGVL